MLETPICCPVTTPAIAAATTYLNHLGFHTTDVPISSAAHILLPVPSFPVCESYIQLLNRQAIISGGNLVHPALDGFLTVDFLQDPYYLAENAAITARCAMNLLTQNITELICSKNALILGWGRIGKCLAKELQLSGFSVTIAARRADSLAMARALGFSDISLSDAQEKHGAFDVIFNTIPAMVLPELHMKHGAIAMELASSPGMSGDHIISARGLPGKYAPEESGKLIAETFIRLSLGKEVES